MKESKSHNYQMPCEKSKDVFRKLHIIDTGDEVLISTDKSGECLSVLWEVLAKFINAVPREKAIEILSGAWDKSGKAEDRCYTCDKGYAGNKSCVDRVAKYLKENIAKED